MDSHSLFHVLPYVMVNTSKILLEESYIIRSLFHKTFCYLEEVANPASPSILLDDRRQVAGRTKKKRWFELVKKNTYEWHMQCKKLPSGLHPGELEMIACRAWTLIVIRMYNRNKEYQWYDTYSGSYSCSTDNGSEVSVFKRDCMKPFVMDFRENCNKLCHADKVWFLQKDDQHPTAPQLRPIWFQRIMVWMFRMFYKANYWSDERQTYEEHRFLDSNTFHMNAVLSRHQMIHTLRLVKQCFETTMKCCTRKNIHDIPSLYDLHLRDSLNATYEWSVDTDRFDFRVSFSNDNRLSMNMKWKNIHDWVNIISPKRSCIAYLIGIRCLSKYVSTGFPMIFGDSGRLNDSTNKLIYAYLKS